ncbi:hypothetical protein ACS0TY_023810 [Phlomoides rotata]
MEPQPQPAAHSHAASPPAPRPPHLTVYFCNGFDLATLNDSFLADLDELSDIEEDLLKVEDALEKGLENTSQGIVLEDDPKYQFTLMIEELFNFVILFEELLNFDTLICVI